MLARAIFLVVIIQSNICLEKFLFCYEYGLYIYIEGKNLI